MRKLQQGEAYRHRFGAFNRFLDWAVHEGLIPANPCVGIGRAYRPAAGGERERTPSLRDLALIWTACETALELVFCDFVRFAITTPARRNEIANLRWEHLDLDARIWSQPGRLTKNRNAHQLRLNPLALQILRRRWEKAGRPEIRTGLPFAAIGQADHGLLQNAFHAKPGGVRCGVVVVARSKKVVRHRARQAWRGQQVDDRRGPEP